MANGDDSGGVSLSSRPAPDVDEFTLVAPPPPYSPSPTSGSGQTRNTSSRPSTPGHRRQTSTSTTTHVRSRVEGRVIAGRAPIASRYLYYRIYSLDGAIESKNVFQAGNLYTGRVMATRITPPLTVKLIKRFLCKQEGIPDSENSDLFTTTTGDHQLSDQDRLPLLAHDSPGSSADNPIALVFKGGSLTTPIPTPTPTATATTDTPPIVRSSSIKVVPFNPSHFSTASSELIHHTNTVTCTAISSDCTRFVSGSSDATICIWDVKSEKVVTGPIATSSVISVALSPDGKYIVSGHSSSPYIRMWDALTGISMSTPFRGHKGAVNSVSYSSDGQQIVSGSGDKTLRIWDAKGGSCVTGPMRGHMRSVKAAVFSPDDMRILSGSDDMSVRAWDASTGKCVSVMDRGNWVSSIAFSPSCRWMVAGSVHDKTVRVEPVGRRSRNRKSGVKWSGAVECVVFSPDGRYVLAGCRNGSMRIWEFKSGEMVGVLERGGGGSGEKGTGDGNGNGNGISSVSVSCKGDQIVAGTKGGTIHMWRKE